MSSQRSTHTRKNNHNNSTAARDANDADAAVKDPNEWTTGDEPATAAQLSYLKTLSHDAGVDFDEKEQITKSEASKRIDALRQKSPRVQESK